MEKIGVTPIKLVGKNFTYSSYASKFRHNFKTKTKSNSFDLPCGAQGHLRIQQKNICMWQDKGRFNLHNCVLHSFEIVLRLIRQQKKTVYFNQA